MNNSQEVTIHKRVNLTLPMETLRLLNRVTRKGDRSGFINDAVRYYIGEVGRVNLKRQLRLGALSHSKRDLQVAEEWFLVDE